jgi:hypothetical protein
MVEEEFETPLEGATKIVLYYYTRAYIMHIFEAVIFISLTGNLVPCYFLPLLKTLMSFITMVGV